VTQGLIAVIIGSDNMEVQINIPAGSTVGEALATAEITLGELDKVEPPGSTILSDGSRIKVTRVKDEYDIEQVIIPFEHQELRNEALPEGERRLSQPGVNGVEEITYHRVFEDGVEVSNSAVKTTVIKEAVPEIMMIGSKAAFSSINIPGKIAYLSAGNAWIIETNTGNRTCIVSSGDLDGRIFSLSKDDHFLLFTRYANGENQINSLWAASLLSEPVKIIDLGVENIVHFAEFDPSSTVVAYSTVESREAAPGWQANNDLYEISVSTNGFVGSPQMDLDANTGGVYGWWGTDYAWSSNPSQFLYSRPDSIGIYNTSDGNPSALLNISPFQTGGDWAWVPGVSLSPSGNVVYSVNHVPSEANTDSDSQKFNLIAIPLTGGTPLDLVQNVGMFAYPVASSITRKTNIINTSSGLINQDAYSVAYLQAIFPDQSETSGYRLFTVDRDGSNRRSLFPEEGAIGLDPQEVVWSPKAMGTNSEFAIAVVYNGNIWIIDSGSGIAQQITGDGLVSRIDWR
jgi:resuscitation-promoting factor RpfB